MADKHTHLQTRVLHNTIINDFMNDRHKLLNGTKNSWNLRHYRSDSLMPVIKACLVGEAEDNPEIIEKTINSIYEAVCNQDINDAYNSVLKYIKLNKKENNGKS